MRVTSARQGTLSRFTVRLLFGLLLALMATPGVAYAQATQYTFTKIADTISNPGVGGISCVGLNSRGTVIAVFQGQLWRGDGQSFTQVTPVIASICPSINDFDEIAYVSHNSQTNISTLVKNSGGTLTTLARSDTAPFLDGGSNTAYTPLSNSGSAAFVALPSPGALGIYVAPNGPSVYNPLTDPPLSFFVGPASINDNLTVPFLASAAGNISIYRGSAVPLIESGDAVSVGIIQIVLLARPVINNSGTVAFVGSTTGSPNVYTTSDGFSLTLVGTSPLDRIAINDSGAVVFRRSLGGQDEGIFVGRPGSPNEKIIAQGDALDGSTYVAGFVWEEAINNSGQVAFFAFLADGRLGVYRADPVDATAPVVTAPTPITIEATQPSGATGALSGALAAFLAGGTATDNADPNPVRLTPRVGGADATNATLFPLGTTTVAFRFEDASGNIGTATSQVTVVSAQRRIAGGGYNFPEMPTYRASFSVDARGPLSPTGSVVYAYTRTRMNFASSGISTFTVNGTTAVIVGTGSVNGVAGYGFTATATDGSPDTFGIVIRRPDGAVHYSTPSVALAGGALTMTAP
ncbi:MAG TPA: choice-of-anchor tandem repeat NxxGxxAF-containing protein [Vicinamibacterales bacterium]|nr:choice-of-anchor tandem repeat NxxGxxAF-containing protein [Vicinamibacterales bacterium]